MDTKPFTIKIRYFILRYSIRFMIIIYIRRLRQLIAKCHLTPFVISNVDDYHEAYAVPQNEVSDLDGKGLGIHHSYLTKQSKRYVSMCNGKVLGIYKQLPNHGLVADKILAASEALASCTFIPKQLQGKPIDIQVVLSIIIGLDVEPLEALRNVYIMHGTIGFKSSYQIFLLKKACQWSIDKKKTRGFEFESTYYEEEGDKIRMVGVRDPKMKPTYIDEAKWSKHVVGEWMSPALAEEGGFKHSNLWKSNPSQMSKYRAASFWMRVYAPQVLGAVYSEEEVRDIKGDR